MFSKYLLLQRIKKRIACLGEGFIMQYADNFQQPRQPPDVQSPSQKEEIDGEAGNKVERKPTLKIVSGNSCATHD